MSGLETKRPANFIEAFGDISIQMREGICISHGSEQLAFRSPVPSRCCHSNCQTCAEGVVMDMHIGDAGDPLTAYIALTRVQDRHGLFIYRPFAAGPFQKGAKVGRELLLRFWAGEKLDWSVLRAKYRDERRCTECNESKPASAFTAGRLH